MGRLTGKTALITGGGEGIGKATALLFSAEEGAKVGIMSRTAARLEEVVAENPGPGEIRAYPGDVSKEEDVKRVVEAFYGDFGKVDILFNNAGIFEGGTVVTTSDDVWDEDDQHKRERGFPREQVRRSAHGRGRRGFHNQQLKRAGYRWDGGLRRVQRLKRGGEADNEKHGP